VTPIAAETLESNLRRYKTANGEHLDLRSTSLAALAAKARLTFDLLCESRSDIM
jgi:hypothetical protein